MAVVGGRICGGVCDGDGGIVGMERCYISGSWAPPNIGVMILGNYCSVTMDSFFY